MKISLPIDKFWQVGFLVKPSTSEVTTLWRYTNVFNIIITIVKTTDEIQSEM